MAPRMALKTAIGITLCLLTGVSWAQQKGQRQVTFSTNGLFYAVSDPKDGQTTVFSVGTNMSEKTRLWSVSGNFDRFKVSEDGQFLAVFNDDWNRVKLSAKTPAVMKDTVLFEFVSRDGERRPIPLIDVVKDPKVLKESSLKGSYFWGHVVGFDEGNRLVVDSASHHRLMFDPKTGMITEDDDQAAKQ